MNVFKKFKLIVNSFFVLCSVTAPLLAAEREMVQTKNVTITVEDSIKLIKSWERIEERLRAVHTDPENESSQPFSMTSAELDSIRCFVCMINAKVCQITQVVPVVGTCNDLVIDEIVSSPCVSIADINAICATLQSWMKTIESELRGNIPVCPPAP